MTAKEGRGGRSVGVTQGLSSRSGVPSCGLGASTRDRRKQSLFGGPPLSRVPISSFRGVPERFSNRLNRT